MNHKPEGVPSLEEVLGLIQSAAWRCYQGLASHVDWDFDDLVQFGVFQYYYTLKVWDPSKGCKFSTLLMTNLRLEYCNIYKATKRRRIVPLLLDVEKKPKGRKRISKDDVKILSELSREASLFLKCLLEPPEELTALINLWQSKRKTWKNQIRIPICEWLGISDRDFYRIQNELREKVQLCCE
jgi:DNA-directed RNA polymerase specialized sigma24 family protein